MKNLLWSRLTAALGMVVVGSACASEPDLMEGATPTASSSHGHKQTALAALTVVTLPEPTALAALTVVTPPAPGPAVEDVGAWLTSLLPCGNNPTVPADPASTRERPEDAVQAILYIMISGALENRLTRGDLEDLAALAGRTRVTTAARALATLYVRAAEFAARVNQDSELNDETHARQVRGDAVVLRRAAVRAGQLVPGDEVTTILASALDDEDAGIRYEAARVLAARPGFPERAKVESLVAQPGSSEEEQYYAEQLRRLLR